MRIFIRQSIEELCSKLQGHAPRNVPLPRFPHVRTIGKEKAAGLTPPQPAKRPQIACSYLCASRKIPLPDDPNIRLAAARYYWLAIQAQTKNAKIPFALADLYGRIGELELANQYAAKSYQLASETNDVETLELLRKAGLT